MGPDPKPRGEGGGGCGELNGLLQDMQRIAPCSSPRESDGGRLSGCAPALLSTPGHTCTGAGLSLCTLGVLLCVLATCSFT